MEISISNSINSLGSYNFLPSLISDLQAWYDANDSSTITDGATFTWADKSGNGYDATQTTGASQPATGTNTLNGNNVITFDGTDDFLTLPSALCSAIPNGDSTIFIVSRQDAIGQERIITMATAANSTRLQVRYNATTGYPAFQNNNTGSLLAGLAGFDSLDYNIITVGHSGSTMTLGANASTEGSNANGADVAGATIGTIGSTGNGGGDYLDGDIAEIIIYNRVLSATEKAKIHRYLYQKWGVLIAGTVVMPTKGSVVVPFNVTYDGYTFDTDLDVADYKITPANTYNSVTDLRSQIGTGNATNDSYEINLTADQDRNTSWNPFPTGETTPKFYPTEDFNILAASATFLTNDQDITMVLDTGTTYKSNAARSSMGTVWDTTITDANGSYERLTLAADLATCRSTAGTYFVDGSDIVYIHTSDQRDLTANSGSTAANGIRVYLAIEGPTVQNNITGYTENLNMEGFTISTYKAGINSASGAPDAIYAKTCDFGYSQSGNGFIAESAGITILQNCIARQNYRDGFNYSDDQSVGAVAYEVGCSAFYNGLSGDGNNNSSTAHDGMYVVRINGNYQESENINVHDVNDNTFTVNVGCEAKDSRSVTSTTNANFVSGTGSDSVTMYLINCKSSGSTYDMVAGSGSTIYVTPASRLLDGNNTEDGTITTFIPQVV